MIDTVKKFYKKIDPTNEISWTNEYIVTYLDGTVSTVPHNESNRHYQEIQKWIADGGTVIDDGIPHE